MDILDWEERPYVSLEQMAMYSARDPVTARNYGQRVKAVAISNRDYGYRYSRFKKGRAMRPPPSSGRIFLGYLVVRNLDTSEQYETWMPEHAFDELYVAASEP